MITTCKQCHTTYLAKPRECHVCKTVMPPGETGPDLEQRLAYIQGLAEAAIRDAELYGVVLTIECEPLQPLAMGNHRMVVSVRERREEPT